MRWLLVVVAMGVGACGTTVRDDGPLDAGPFDAGVSDPSLTPHDQCLRFQEIACAHWAACKFGTPETCHASFGGDDCTAPHDYAPGCSAEVKAEHLNACASWLATNSCTGDGDACKAAPCP
jgi:hypothetical protein